MVTFDSHRKSAQTPLNSELGAKKLMRNTNSAAGSLHRKQTVLPLTRPLTHIMKQPKPPGDLPRTEPPSETPRQRRRTTQMIIQRMALNATVVQTMSPQPPHTRPLRAMKNSK